MVLKLLRKEPQKPTKKAKVVKTTTSEILPRRTRGGASTRASPDQPPKKTRKQPKKTTRKLVELSAGIQEEIMTEAAEGLKDLIVEDPKEVVAREQAEDR